MTTEWTGKCANCMTTVVYTSYMGWGLHQVKDPQLYKWEDSVKSWMNYSLCECTLAVKDGICLRWRVFSVGNGMCLFERCTSFTYHWETTTCYQLFAAEISHMWPFLFLYRNGHLLDGLHLRVDLAGMAKKVCTHATEWWRKTKWNWTVKHIR